MKVKMVDAQQGESIAQYASRLNLTAGEIYTLVGFAINNEKSGSSDLISREVGFGFSRLVMKDVSASTTAMSAATYGDFFTIDTSGAQLPLATLVSANLDITQIVPGASTPTGSLGVIRSNENSGLRSTSDMVCPFEISTDLENIWGVAPINLFAAWSRESSGLQSPLILEVRGFLKGGVTPPGPTTIDITANFSWSAGMFIVSVDGLSVPLGSTHETQMEAHRGE